jgi:hypothetical protein
MLMGERDITMIFADVGLQGVMDGIDLAWELKQRWPLLPMVLTSGCYASTSASRGSHSMSWYLPSRR